jgi:predicted nucleotidyltransferase
VTRFGELIRRLDEGGVEFIVIGGIAAIAHGTARATYDLDIVYRRTPENLDRMVRCLAPIAPYLRGAPPGLPFRFDVETLRAGLNFTLTTQLGDLDLLGEVTGGGRYEDLAAETVEMEIFGQRCRCLGLERLIAVKRAAGRPKDFEAIAELEALREEMERDRP